MTPSIASGTDVARQAFVTRQPIIDRSGEVRAYELHYRSDPWSTRGPGRDDAATLQLLDTTLLQHAIGDLTDGLPAYLSFTEHTLIQDFALLLPPEAVVVQLAASVRASDDALQAADRLARRGYRLAVDGFQPNDPRMPFLGTAAIVKIDFLGCPELALQNLTVDVAGVAELVATNIDTQVMRRFAESLGAVLFQGDFLAAPDPLEIPDIPVGKFERLRLLQQLNRPEMDLREVEELIKRDPGLSYRLLLLVNSAAIGLRDRINDIRQAIIMLGQVGMLKWASVLALKDVGAGRPTELLRESIFRARFCESLAVAVGLTARSSELFLLGLFSRMDALTGRPLIKLMDALPLADDIKHALQGDPGIIRSVYDLVLAYEHGDWPFVELLATQLGMDMRELPHVYRDAVRWSGSLTRGR